MNKKEEIKKLSDLRYEFIDEQEKSWNEKKLDYNYNPPEIDKLGERILTKIKTDKDQLEFEFIIEELTKLGQAPNMIYDDNGHFAVTSTGIQEVPEHNDPQGIAVTSFITEDQWKNSPREALYYYLEH